MTTKINLDYGLIIRERHPNINFEAFTKWRYKFIQIQLKRLKHKEILNQSK
jgi:hypothetical protein